MSEIVERVAAVFWEGLNRDIPGAYRKFDDLPDPQRGMLLAATFSAIGAMREPTYEQFVAAGHSTPSADGLYAQIWHAMIDAALTD